MSLAGRGYGLLTVTSGSLMERAEPIFCRWSSPRHDRPGPQSALRMAVAQTDDSPAVPANWASRDRVLLGRRDAGPAGTSAAHAEAALRMALARAICLPPLHGQALVIRRHDEARLTGFLGANLGGSLLDERTARHFSSVSVPPKCRWAGATPRPPKAASPGPQRSANPVVPLPGAEGAGRPAADPRSRRAARLVLPLRGRFESVQISSWRLSARPSNAIAARSTTGFVPSGQQPGSAGLSEAERLQLVARTVELVRSLDPATPALVSFDQPWESICGSGSRTFPVAFRRRADPRRRRSLRPDARDQYRYWPGGTLLRHPWN